MTTHNKFRLVATSPMPLADAPFGSRVVDGSTPAQALPAMSTSIRMASSITAATLRFVTRMNPSQEIEPAAPAGPPQLSCRRDTVDASDGHIRCRSGFLTGTAS